MKIYLDSVVLVYYLDHLGPFQVRAANRLAALHAAGDVMVVSDVVRMECRMDPIRKGEAMRLDRFDGFFTHPDVQFIPITTAVFDRATRIRAIHNHKAVDSIHLAAAVEGGCDIFLTNDLRLSGFPDLMVEILP